MSGEEYLARKYCEPKPYWHCLHGLSGGNYYSFNELNYPEYWLDAVAKYIQGKPSTALKQLHRRVEAARAEFKAKQDRAWGRWQGRSGHIRVQRVVGMEYLQRTETSLSERLSKGYRDREDRKAEGKA